ncbi:MAG: murein biosynthesis integral membrane protein MurJ [Micrococcales bacterium]|nr:murein biosynthesis integral membrane protein MurJ [Actinomycetota bacterium]NCA07815.1 murein biosynthesis integral membrane protein MurJ [Micrococcales bacterium]
MSVLRSSLIMASGTVFSRLLGIIRAIMLAATIGVTTNAADAFGVANQLPNNVYAIIVGGVLNAVLVPQIVRARGHVDGGKGYIDRLLTMAIVVFGGITVITTLTAPLLVSVYTNGWSAGQLALATAFAYWCLPQLFFYGLYTLLGEVLNARSKFGPFMWAPVLNNIVAILGMGAFIWQFGLDPTGQRDVENWGQGQIALLAGTATLGVAAQALILFVFWKKMGLSFNLNFNWRGVGLAPAMRTASWTLGMLLITQVGGIVQTAVASKAIGGREIFADNRIAIASVAAMSIAWLIFMLPHSVATVSIATAYFTRMSTHAMEKKFDELKNDLSDGLRTIAMISVLATAGLIVLAYPISRVFVGEIPSAIALGNVVIAMVVGLLPFSYVFMIQRAFYSLEDTRTPFIFTLVQTILNIIGSVFVAIYVEHIWIVVSLSLVTSGSILIQSVLAFLMFKRRFGSLGHAHLTLATAKFAAAALVAGLIGFSILQAMGGANPGAFPVLSIVASTLTCALIGGVMVVVYLLILRFLKVKEIETLTEPLMRLLGRS